MKLQEVYDLIVESAVGQFSGAGIIFFDGTKVLMLKKRNGRWVFPGGKPIQGETPIATAKRESKEEVGQVSGKNVKEIKFELDNRTFYSYIFIVNKQFDVRVSEEHTDYTWINYKKVKELKLHKNVLKSIPKVFKELNTIKVELV